MRKLFVLVAFLCVMSEAIGHAVKPHRDSFRDCALQELPLMNAQLTDMYSLIDSLRSKNTKVYAHKLDSLSTDSIFMASGALPYLLIDKHFEYVETNQPGMAIQTIRLFQNSVQGMDESSPCSLLAHPYMSDYFAEIGDFQSAYRSQVIVQNQMQSELQKLSEESSHISDSLQQQIKSERASITKLEQEVRDTEQLWMIIAGGVLVLLIVMIIIYFVSVSSWKKKLRAQMEKANDRTELELLTKKMNELKAEANQFRNTAQATVDRLNAMDDTGRKASHEIKILSEELSALLGDIRQQCETSKNNIPLATYMEFQNIATRSGSALTQHVQKIQEILK